MAFLFLTRKVDLSGEVFHFLLYGYVFFFMLVIVAFMLLYGKTAEKEIRRTIWRFWFIEAACLFLQIAAERILLTGFGLSVGLWLIYLTMNNPGEYTDSMTGLFDKQYFDKWIRRKALSKRSFHLLAVDARNMKQNQPDLRYQSGDQLLDPGGEGISGDHGFSADLSYHRQLLSGSAGLADRL